MMNELNKISWIFHSFNWLSRRQRLIIEYGLVVVIMITASLTATMWFEKEYIVAQLNTIQGKVVVIESVNEKQELTIHDLDKNHLALKGKLSDLEKNDAALRKYLNTPLPNNLGCVLPGGKC